MEAFGAILLLALLTLNWALAPGIAASECSGFRHLENGRTFFRYGGLYVTFSCNPGFRMHGHRTSSCVSGQWARHPPLCVAPGCPSPGKLLQGTTLLSPDGSLVQFTCNTGFRLFGSPLLYCKGKSWNGSAPVCKELDLMSLFQQKQTSLYKPGTELNQDVTNLKNHFSAIASTAAKESFLKSSLLGAPQPKPQVTGDSSAEHPNLPKRLGHDQITTQATVETVGQTLLATTLLPTTLSKRTQSTLLVTSAVNDQQEVSSCFLAQMLSSTTKGEDEREIYLTSTAQMHHESPSTPVQDLGASRETALESVLESTVASTISKAKTRPADDFPPRTERPTTRIPVVHLTPVVTTRALHPKHQAKGSTMVDEPRKLLVGQTDGELYVSGPGKIAPARSSLLTLKNHKENATAKQSVLNRTRDSTAKNISVTTSSVSGFPVFHSSKRRPVCPYPPLPAHGTFYFHTIPNPVPFQYKHYIQYACYAGYTLANGDVYSYCLQDGRWSGVTPMCIGSTPCSLNNGGCSQVCQVNAYNRAECHCEPGFLLLGDRRTCRDLDECMEGLHECQQVCENTFGSYRCSCSPGFQLSSNKMSCTDVNECAPPAGTARCAFGCVNAPGSFHCLCPAGYSMNATDGLCEDIDECSENTGLGPCSNACVNTPGSFHCACANGYQLAADGMTCISECPPGYRKKGPDALAGNSAVLPCADINECEEMEQMQRHQQHKCEWKCVNLPGTRRCICPRGYTRHPNGYQCKDIDECTVRNGGCSHLCTNHRGGYKCACPENYRISTHSRKKCQAV